MSEFWQLPAPTGLVRAIAEDIRSGNNVILTMPEHAPEGWLPALRAKLRSLNLQKLEVIDCNGATPLETIASHVVLPGSRATLRVDDLCDRHEFQGRLLYFRADCPRSWPAWGAFLAQYEDSCRRYDLAQRTLFMVSLHGEVISQVPQPANLLRVHSWCGFGDGLNIRLYATDLLGGVEMKGWQRHLAVELIAELALWDPSVCEAGVGRGLRALIEPSDWLRELGEARGWTGTEDSRAPASEWGGYRHRFEGRDRLHSAWLTLAGRSETLKQRVWNAQVSGLFPLIERQRRTLLKTYRGILKVPWDTEYRQIEKVEDLELNHIADQLGGQRSGGLRETCEYVRWLRDIRNDLAHLAPVSADHLLQGRFQARLERFLAAEEE